MTVYKGIGMIVIVIFDLSLSRNGSPENHVLIGYRQCFTILTYNTVTT